MIDRTARDRLAVAMRAFATGRIDSDTLDEALMFRSPDPAVRAASNFAWTLYDDTWNYLARGEDALSRSSKADIARCILFLKSDAAYQWPDRSALTHSLLAWFAPILNIATWGAYGRWIGRRAKHFFDCGDVSVWPFRSRRQLSCIAEGPAAGLTLRRPG